MMPLDFKRATDLFMGREEELARALSIEQKALRRYRDQPSATPPVLLHALAHVLDERGRAMIRVGEMLQEEASDAERQANGRGGN
jgi:hypothetical protein